MIANSSDRAEPQAKPKDRQPLALDLDREFATFVNRMLKASHFEYYSSEQLAFATTPTAKRRVRTVLECRNSEGRLHLTKYCQRACPEAYLQLARCVRYGQQGSADGPSRTPRCIPESAALSKCVRHEWQQFLFAVSPPTPDEFRMLDV